MDRTEWKNIVCPVDFSDASKAALHLAANLATRFDGSLTLIHVAEVPGWMLPTGDVVLTQNMVRRATQEFETQLEDWVQMARSPSLSHVASELIFGSPFSEILRFTTEHACDVLVMGTHGRGTLKHAFLGSVTEKVLRKCPCPVVTVRSPL